MSRRAVRGRGDNGRNGASNGDAISEFELDQLRGISWLNSWLGVSSCRGDGDGEGNEGSERGGEGAQACFAPADIEEVPM